jgi:hypothetical protein
MVIERDLLQKFRGVSTQTLVYLELRKGQCRPSLHQGGTSGCSYYLGAANLGSSGAAPRKLFYLALEPRAAGSLLESRIMALVLAHRLKS